jgi:hypothetical protein
VAVRLPLSARERRPLGLILEQPHSRDGVGLVDSEAVVDAGTALVGR